MALWRKVRVNDEFEDSDEFGDRETVLDEARTDERLSLHRSIVKWTIGFAIVFIVSGLAFWWSGSAIRYSASRVQSRTNASYEVSGRITDSRTHAGVPWAEIATEFQFGGAYFRAWSDQDGNYTIRTLAEPHTLVVQANGYKAGRLTVGKQWFAWLPNGNEHRDLQLTPER